ncbi:MAG TPA: hypothetical protein VIX73_08815 [Kofleriaceae bacterium]|jgi:hypothetical protein
MPNARAIPHVAMLCAIGFVIANAAFYFLSGSYFDSHHQIVGGARVASFTAEQASHIRIVFALVSGGVALAAFAAGVWRRDVSHGLAALLGLFNLVAGWFALRTLLPGPARGALVATLVITGALMPALAVLSYRRSRPAWAFLVALCGVFAVVGLFGAPKIRGAVDVSLWTTMILPGLFTVACISLALLRDDYVDRSPV